MIAFLSQFTAPVIYALLVLILVASGFGNPIPEDAALITGGYLAFAEVLHLVPVLIVSYVGVVTGDVILYGLGRRYGQHIITHRHLVKLIPPQRIERIRQTFIRHGHYTILFARFLIGLRSPTFLLSGVMHLPFRKFLLLDAIGALFSVPLFVGLGYLFGSSIETLRNDIRRVEYWLLLVGGVAIIALIIWYWKKVKRDEVLESTRFGSQNEIKERHDEKRI